MKHYKAPRALICGMLEKDGKCLFLMRKGSDGTERIEMPWVYGTLAGDPVGAIGEAFRKQSSVKVHALSLAIEAKEDIGVDGEQDVVPVLVFRMIADRKPMEQPCPASGYSGYEWLTLEEAARRPLAMHARWLGGELIRVE